MHGPRCRISRVWSAVLAACLLLAPPELASSEEKAKPQTKRVQAVSEWAFKRLSASHDAIAAGNYAEALAKIDDLKDSPRLNDYEDALVWQTYGYVYGMQEKYAEAAAAFEKTLAKNALPDAAQANVQFNVAQLYVMLERFPEASAVFQDWFSKTPDPSPDAHYVYAIALFQSGDKAKALEQGLAAIKKAKVPKEAWLQLVLSGYIDGKQYADAVGVLEALTGLYPKKNYWLQLSALYAEVGDYQKALSALVLAYDQGMLTEERELEHLTQLYLYNRVPYRAALVLEKAMAEGRIAGTSESWQRLAEAWVAAREREKAQGPLAKAAAESSDGELFLRLAQVQIEHEQWVAARQSLARAVEKGGLEDPGNAHLLLGIASASDSKWEDAKKAFQVATGYEKSAGAAREWLVQVEDQLGKANKKDLPAKDPGRVAQVSESQMEREP